MIRKFFYALLVLFVIGLSYLFYIGDKANTGERNAMALIKDKVFNTQKESVNLIICWTPLQMVIAEKIIDQNPNEKFYVIQMSYTQNERFGYYFNRLKNKSEKAFSFYFPPFWENDMFIYTTLVELKLKNILFPEVKTIFLANFDKSENHTIVSTHSSAQIKTFDDGTANLIKDSYLLNNYEHIRKRFYKIFINPTPHTKRNKKKFKRAFYYF